jgi:murein DD-endopeptidase MepM/ murein hydrolase activator NlpD
MSLSRVGIVCVSFFALTAANAGACEMAEFKGVDGFRLKRPVPGRVASGFGMRKHPLLQITRFHQGVDFAVDVGTPVLAAAKGRVSFADQKGEFGNMVVIDHRDGLATAYAHLNRIGVQAGDCVGEGDVIGFAGATGLAAVPQLHFEVRVEGRHVDPAPAIGSK